MPPLPVKKFKGKSILIATGLLLPFIALILLMKLSGGNQQHSAPIKAKLHQVEVLPVEILSGYSQPRQVLGKVESSQLALLGFDLAGTLLNISVDEGDHVQQGQQLALLDAQRLSARMHELAATLESAKAQAQLASLSERRTIELVSKKLEPAQRLDEAKSTASAAKALVAEIEARQRSLAVEQNKTRLIAPFSGVIVSRPVDAGTVVAAGQPVLTLQRQAGLEVRVALSANDAFKLKVEQTYQFTQTGPGSQQQFAATLKTIGSQRRANTRTVDAIFSLTDGSLQVLAGDLLSMSFSREIKASGSWVPTQALTSGIRGLWTVYVVTPQPQQSQASGKPQRIVAKTVEIIYAQTNKVFVRGALKDDDLLVINGVQRLVPEQLVEAKLSLIPALAKVPAPHE